MAAWHSRMQNHRTVLRDVVTAEKLCLGSFASLNTEHLVQGVEMMFSAV